MSNNKSRNAERRKLSALKSALAVLEAKRPQLAAEVAHGLTDARLLEKHDLEMERHKALIVNLESCND